MLRPGSVSACSGSPVAAGEERPGLPAGLSPEGIALPTLLNISEAASLALHTVVVLAARGGEVVSTRAVAEAIQASEAHLSKVLQRLARVGLVRSLRGPKGGFVLSRPPDAISMLEVFEAIEGPLVPHTCLFRQKVCDGAECILGDCLKRASESLKTRLTQTRVADLVSIFQRKAPRTTKAKARTRTGAPEPGAPGV